MRIAALLIATFSLAACGGQVDSGVEPGTAAALSPRPLTYSLEIPHAEGAGTWALLSNPLHQGMNHVADVLTNVPSGTTVYKFGSDGLWQITSFESFPDEGAYWSPDLILAPGDGFFIHFPNAGTPNPLVINFAGLAPAIGESFTRPVPGPGQFTLVGSMLPRAGKLGEDLAFPLAAGDTIYRWNKIAQGYDLFEYPSGGDPMIAMGESVFVQRAGNATTWRQTDTAGWVSSSIARVSTAEPLSGTIEVTVALEATHPADGVCLIAATPNINTIHEFGCIAGPLWTGEYTFTVDTTVMENGIFGFQAQSGNNVGDSTAQHGQNFSVFNDRPGTAHSRITSPAASTTINGTVQFEVDLAASHAVDEMCLMAAATLFPANQQPARNLGCLSNIGSGAHTYLVDTRGMGNGDWSFSATLRSSIDATSAAASIIRVNNGVPPGVAESRIISPTAGPSLTGPVTFRVQMTAPHTVEEMCLEGTGPNNATGSFGCHRNIPSGTYTYTVDTRHIAEGEWTFRARPVNQIDTINAIESTFTVLQVVATARIVSPMDGATIRGTVELGISIDQPVEVICYQAYEIATWAVTGNCISGYFQPGTHNITLDTTTLVNGTWNFEPLAFFGNGRMATVRSNLIIAN